MSICLVIIIANETLPFEIDLKYDNFLDEKRVFPEVYGMSPLSPKSHCLVDSDLIRSVFSEELVKTMNSLEDFTSTII